MQPLRILQELRKKFCPSSTENPAPPSYHEASKTNPPSPENLKRIASKVPQWKWSTKECRDWLRAVCVVYFNFSLQEAEASAMKFEGFGATLYMKIRDSWMGLLGENGRGLYGLLFGLRRKRGAVPKSMKLLNWPLCIYIRNGRLYAVFFFGYWMVERVTDNRTEIAA